MIARSKKVRTPVCHGDFEDLGAGLNLDRCTMVGDRFWTTYALCLRLHYGVCSIDTRSISIVEGGIVHY